MSFVVNLGKLSELLVICLSTAKEGLMKEDYTHISIILDRSGSMESIRDDTIGGFNCFLHAQKALPESATITLVQFDSQDPYEVIHSLKPIHGIPDLDRLTFVPRASTPLLDAIGRGINDTESRIAAINESDRPAYVVFIIVTDGQENSSQEFRKDQIVQMIKQKEEQSNWQFVFLSSDLSAIRDAEDAGIKRNAILMFKKTRKGTENAWNLLAKGTERFRSSPIADRKFEFIQDDYEQTDEPENN